MHFPFVKSWKVPRVLIFVVATVAIGACGEDKRSAPHAPAPSSSAAAAAERGADAEHFAREAFPSAIAALGAVLARSTPRVLAFGEVHAPKGARVESATARFRQQLLPLLAPSSAAIVVEAWQPSGCNQAVEAKVAKANREVTQHQAATNTNEYVELAQEAKARGLVALPLRPTCEESARVADAGASDLAMMLQTVTQVAQRTIESALDKSPADKRVLFYGGALHNDLRPSAERAAWSFGPALAQRTLGAFTEVDLVVPEFIEDDEVWRKLPWRGAYDLARDGAGIQLLSRGAHSFVIVFARTAGAVAPEPPRE